MIEERPEKYDVVTPDGEVISAEDVRFAYTREGRRVIGKEYPNPVPMEPPIGFIPQEPLHMQIRRMVMHELSQVAEAEGLETAEEADDFEVGDDYDPTSPYEMDFEPTAPWPGNPEVLKAEAEAVQANKNPDQVAAAAEKVEGGGGSEAPQAPSK